MKKQQLVTYIDHTVLKATATKDEVTTLCEEAVQYQFAAVCVNPCWVPLAQELLKESSVNVCTVIGFPLGATSTEVKEFETEWALKQGACEIDMVINVGAAKTGDWQLVEDEIAALARIVHNHNASLKVILETCFLSHDEIAEACRACVRAEADYVKTSTGFGTGGASVEHVALMTETVQGKCKVKASGGIRDSQQAMAMIEAGADRLGTSSGVAILAGFDD